MSTNTRKQFPMALALGVIAAAAWLLSNQPNQPASADEPEGRATRWDYTSVEIDASTIDSKLGELAIQKWEVFSIVRSDSVVDQDGDGKTHVLASKFRVTAKKRVP